jgi:hypothetical protein
MPLLLLAHAILFYALLLLRGNRVLLVPLTHDLQPCLLFCFFLAFQANVDALSSPTRHVREFRGRTPETTNIPNSFHPHL